MKLDRLETHDRLLHFKKDQALNIAQGAEDCLKKNPLSLAIQSRSPYVYIFAHPRTADDGVTKVMYWQPRLTKPKAQTNSYLFRAISNTDNLEVCWLLPPRETVMQFNKGNMMENELVIWSYHHFDTKRYLLDAKPKDDFDDDRCKMIMIDIAREMDEQKRMDTLYKISNEK